MEDYYQIIGTSREAVYYRQLNERQRPEEIDKFIQEKYEHTIKLIEMKKTSNVSKEKLEELEQQFERATFAYEQIKSPILREIYEQTLNHEEQEKMGKKPKGFKKKTAFSTLGVNETQLESRTDEENDAFLRKRKENLMDHYLKMLKNTKNFSNRTKFELLIQKIKADYELIKTADKRKKYKQLQIEEEKKEIKRIREQEIEEKYSHVSEYNPNLIKSKSSDYKSLDEIMIVRKENLSKEYFYEDKENRKLRIRQIATIDFKNWTNTLFRDTLSEYQVTREIDGQEIVDVIYTDLSIYQLSIDRKTGKTMYPSYYNCVINELLSEDVIAGSKYNGGYIGKIEKDKKGNYYITLGEEELSEREKEALTAVMIIKKREEKMKEEREGESK